MPQIRLRRGRWTGPVFGFVLALSSGCGDDRVTKDPFVGNRVPVIRRIGYVGSYVLTHQSVAVYANVQDPEGDDLSYFWSASDGVFPLGRRAPSVAWRSPDDPGPESLLIRTWDYQDTARAVLRVSVETVQAPDSLKAFAGTSIADLEWSRSRDDGVDGWAGYEVFRSDRPFSSVPPDSIEAYRVTAGPVPATSLRVPGLARGRIYYFRVGALRAWEGRTERSGLTVQADAAPRPEWMKQVQELESPTGVQGIDLSSGEIRHLEPTDASDRVRFDLYCGTSDPRDGPGTGEAPAELRLKSVSLLANRDPGWAERVVGIKLLGSAWTIPPLTDDGWSEEVPLVEGMVYAVKTPERNYAKVLVLSVAGRVWPYRQIGLKWAYQSVPGYPRL